MTTHTLALQPDAKHRGPALHAAGAALNEFARLIKGAVAMAFRRSSVVRGATAPWLQRASDIEVADVRQGRGRVLVFSLTAPPLGEAAHELYQQQALFDSRPAPELSALDLLALCARDVVALARDSERFDAHWLHDVQRLQAAVLRPGIAALLYQVDGDQIAFDEHLISNAGQLVAQTPAPQRTRVVGKLDMVRYSDHAFELLLQNGQRLRGVWQGTDTQQFKELGGKEVTVEGDLHYRASGNPLRLEAEVLMPPRQQDLVFTDLPVAPGVPIAMETLRRRQPRHGGFAAVFGRWPGDESEEELLAATARR